MKRRLSWVWVSTPTATFLLGVDAAGIVRAGPPYAHGCGFIGQDERVVADRLRRPGVRFVRLDRTGEEGTRGRRRDAADQ